MKKEISKCKQTNKQKMDRQNLKTNGKSKAIQTKSHTESYPYTLTQREKEKKYIYLCSKVHLLNLGWFVVYSGIHRCTVHQVDCGDLILCSWGCWEKFPFLFLVRIAPGVQLWFVPASACRSPKGVCSSLRQDGVKGAADSWTVGHSGQGEGEVQSAERACGSRGRCDVSPAWGSTGYLSTCLCLLQLSFINIL